MRVYKEIPKVSNELKELQGNYIALGNFDGVHLGHYELISNCIKKARDNGSRSIIYTFSPHPEQLLFPNTFKGYINSSIIKECLLEKYGIDILINQKFTEEFALKTPEEFIKDYLVKQLSPKGVFIGFNYSFGRGGKGTPDTLKKLGEKYGFEVKVELPVYFDSFPISSSRIRKYLKVGDIKHARELLGYWPEIEGKIVKGTQIGGQLGFPTANLAIDNSIILPCIGVYATYITINGKDYKSVTNIGYKPTFSGKVLTVETHILNFSNNIYNEHVYLKFVNKIRDEEKFSSTSQLKQQIKIDINKAKLILNGTL